MNERRQLASISISGEQVNQAMNHIRKTSHSFSDTEKSALLLCHLAFMEMITTEEGKSRLLAALQKHRATVV